MIEQAWWCPPCGRYFRYREDAKEHEVNCDGRPPLHPQNAPIE